MKIRELKQSDIGNCAKLFASVFSAAPWNESWSEDDSLTRLSDDYSTPRFSGVVCETSILEGFVYGVRQRYESKYVFHVKEMCVRPESQGTGIGTKLLERLKSDLSAEGVESIYLLTAKDSVAEKFYSNRGFRDANRIKLMTNG